MGGRGEEGREGRGRQPASAAINWINNTTQITSVSVSLCPDAIAHSSLNTPDESMPCEKPA